MAMKKIVSLFKQRWLVSLLGLIALAIFVWFAGPFVAFAGRAPLASEVARLVLILVLVLAWGLNNLRKQMQAKRADTQIAAGLVESAPAASGAAEQSAAEVAALKARFEEALEILKKRSGQRGKRSLYELPWYIIVGPPGSGKTTALVNSGLEFPLAEKFGRTAVRGVGGTRDCDWWFTNEAVLLDTAGRYTTQDSDAQVDRAAWEGFLGLLKKHRRRRPINGVIVATSIADLMAQTEAERRLHVSAVKQRLSELRQHLGIRFPVYMVFTKCDLVAGFTEFFDDLGRDERAQVWGVTFPFETGEAGVVQTYGSEFDDLMERLNGRLLWRLHQERDPRRRGLIFGFPHQVSSLKTLVDGFLREIFLPNRFEEPHILRGVYFSSGTQEGTPIDRLMASVATTFGLDRQVLPSQIGRGRSYFITSLFKRVIFPEADLVGVNRRFERQRTWLQRGAYVGSVGLTAAAALAWSTSYTANRSYLTDVQGRLTEYEKDVAGTPPAQHDFAGVLSRLDSADKVVKTATRNDESVPWHMRFWLYQGDGLGDAARDAFLRELNAVLRPAVASRVKEQLQSAAGNPDLQYEALKVYLMLGRPERLDRQWVRLWMHEDWKGSRMLSAAQRDRLEGYLTTLLDAGMDAVPLDKALVDRARASLKQVPLAQSVYARLKREALATDQLPFRFSDAVGPEGARVFARKSGQPLDTVIPGFFTYRGYLEVFRVQSAELAGRVRQESWVLGLDQDQLSKSELEELDKGLEELYMADYVRAWDNLLNDLELRPFVNVQQGMEMLNILSGPSSPLRGLLQAVERNTSLTRAPPSVEGAMEKAIGKAAAKSRLGRLLPANPPAKAPGAAVERHFAPLNALVKAEGGAPQPIDRICGLLAGLYAYLNGLADQSAPPDPQRIASSDASQNLQAEAVREPEPVKSWLLQVVASAQGVVKTIQKSAIEKEKEEALQKEEQEKKEARQRAREDLEQKWAALSGECTEALSNRYPFDKNSSEDVTLEDFGRFFAKGGLLDKFFEDNLKSLVDTSGKVWKLRPEGVALGVPADVPRQFQKAQAIREAFFQSGGQLPLVRFNLQPVRMDAQVYEFELELDGQRFSYRHGPPRVTSAQWPGPNSPGLIRMEFKDTGGQRHQLVRKGPWAWFRVLDAAKAKQQGKAADRLVATFEVEERTISYEIHASSVVNPFLLGDSLSFRCPGGM
jgi:type VI secretion system protein ImpL